MRWLGIYDKANTTVGERGSREWQVFIDDGKNEKQETPAFLQNLELARVAFPSENNQSKLNFSQKRRLEESERGDDPITQL